MHRLHHSSSSDRELSRSPFTHLALVLAPVVFPSVLFMPLIPAFNLLSVHFLTRFGPNLCGSACTCHSASQVSVSLFAYRKRSARDLLPSPLSLLPSSSTSRALRVFDRTLEFSSSCLLPLSAFVLRVSNVVVLFADEPGPSRSRSSPIVQRCFEDNQWNQQSDGIGRTVTR